jgi:hypothetical protein
VIVAALATPACAQLATGNTSGSSNNGAPPNARPSITLGGDQKSKSEDDIKYERALDRAYKSGMSKIPDQKANADPWGNLRGAAPAPSKSQRPASK